MEFTKDHQPTKGRGRVKGSKNKRSQFTKLLTDEALKQVTAAVASGESWAIQLVINRTHPQLKAITPVDSLDGELLQAKIKEVAEFEQRLLALEAQANES